MLSVLTNSSATSALRGIEASQARLAKAQRQVATGLRVDSARDDAAYWSIATTMSTRVGELQAVNDGLDLTSAIISTTTAALTNILEMTRRMAGLAVATQSAGVDASAAQSEIAGLQAAIQSTAKAATFNGVNWLVTRVVGSTKTTDTRHIDATFDQDQDVRAHGVDGVVHEAATLSVGVDATRTLASTSSSEDETADYALFTLNRSTTNGIQSINVTASNQSSISQSSGDPTGYRFGQIPVSVGSDGSVLYSTKDFHTGELFQTFSGTSSSGLQATYTDRTISFSSPSVRQADQSPYLPGSQDDVLDKPFFTSRGTTNILQMVLTNADDAAFAAPAIDTAIAALTKAMTFFGGLQNEVDGSRQLNTTIIDALTSGVGSLVDADMDETSGRLVALRTQVRLGLQSLAVANGDGRVILQLFAS